MKTIEAEVWQHAVSAIHLLMAGPIRVYGGVGSSRILADPTEECLAEADRLNGVLGPEGNIEKIDKPTGMSAARVS